MFARSAVLASAAFLAFGLISAPPEPASAQTAAKPMVRANGVIRVPSAHGVEETVLRLKKDIAAKGIMFFSEIDQGKLAGGAGIAIRPSVLLVFGNPPLGTQFLSSNPESGLDWPVRMLVFQDAQGQVWVAYTDFGYIARRHGIKDREAQFKMASAVAASVASSAQAR